LAKIEGFVKSALDEGAKLLCGGQRMLVEGLEKGHFFSPCILTNITPKMRVYREEIFGPVALIIPFSSDEEALRIANDTDFGLAAGIFTKYPFSSIRITT
jgi:acyl-CoA reductase-like NAD-dependent aldehyde dehydrogenase